MFSATEKKTSTKGVKNTNGVFYFGRTAENNLFFYGSKQGFIVLTVLFRSSGGFRYESVCNGLKTENTEQGNGNPENQEYNFKRGSFFSIEKKKGVSWKYKWAA